MKCYDCKGKGFFSFDAPSNSVYVNKVICGACAGEGKVSLWIFIKQYLGLIDWSKYQ